MSWQWDVFSRKWRHHAKARRWAKKWRMMTKGGGVSAPPKNDDVIYEQPLNGRSERMPNHLFDFFWLWVLKYPESLFVPSWQYSLIFFSAPDAQEVMCVCGGDGDGDDGDEPNVHLPRDLSEHIPLIVTTNILLQRFSVVVTINIWILHQIFIVTTFICCNKYCYN